LALVQAIAGTSPFPIVPWLAYFFFGAAGSLIAKDPRARWAAGLLSVGAYATASFGWHGFGNMPPAHPLLVSFRVGAVLLLLAFLEVLPSRAAAVLARLAKYSLNVYVIHVPVVYGWFTLQGLSQRIGPRLAFHEAALMALAVLAAAIAAAAAMRRVAGAARGWLLFTRCSSTAHPGAQGACSERVRLPDAAP
jgi:hypothetical protein